MGDIVKFNRPKQSDWEQYRMLNALKTVKKGISHKVTDSICMIWMGPNGSVGYMYHGPRMGELIKGMEAVKLRILHDINAI